MQSPYDEPIPRSSLTAIPLNNSEILVSGQINKKSLNEIFSVGKYSTSFSNSSVTELEGYHRIEKAVCISYNKIVALSIELNSKTVQLISYK